MKEIIQRQRQMMDEYHLDALVTMSPENITYVTGTAIPTQLTVRQRQVIHILTPTQGPEVIVVNIEEPIMRAQGWIDQDRIVSYNEFTQTPIRLAAETLRKMGAARGRLGFELSYLPATDMEILRRELPEAEIVNADPLFEKMRLVKLAFELERIMDLGSRVEDVIYTAFSSVRAGMTEKDILNYLINGFNDIGGDKLNMPVVASGERSCLLNGAATDRVLRKGDVVRVDMIGTKGNYYCDCCRTAVVGEPEARHVNVWEKVVQAHDDTIALIRPGVDTKEIYRQFRDQFVRCGFEPIAFVGHGLGLTLHEEPYINPYKNTVLQENMVLCVEPIHVIQGDCGYQLENEVLVTADGHRMITGTRHPYRQRPVIPAD